MSETELAWAAGFFDGEGCTYLKKSTKWGWYAAKVSVHQVDIRPLQRFQAALGGIGNISGPTRGGEGNRRPIHHWQATSKSEVARALLLMWPYLCEVKREQAVEVVAAVMLAEVARRIPPKTHCKRGHTLEDALSWMDRRGSIHRSCRTCDREMRQRRRAAA